MVGSRLLVLLLVVPNASGCLKSIAESALREFIYAVATLPRLPKWLRSSFTSKRNCGEDVAECGLRPAVPVCRVRMAIFATVAASEFRDGAGSVWKPDDAEVSGATGSARW